jgi:mono/diheme cytochrome c family protein/small nuclear ribonucleoprotein (snRNP)-like protein
MRTVRARALVLVAGVAIGPLLYAQAAPGTAPAAGDAARGKAIFEGAKGNCVSCHRASGAGSLYGPDLSAIGAPQRAGGAGGRGGGAAAPGGNARGGAAAPPAAAVPPTPPLEEQLTQSILDPNAVVSVQNRYVRLTMKDGRTIWGKLLNLDTFAVQIFDSTEKLANISRQDVRDLTMTSPMPSYRDKLTAGELATWSRI